MALQQKIREDGGSFLATLNGGLYQRLAWKWFFGDMQNSSDFSTRATRKTTRFSLRDAKYNAAGAMHQVAWALQTAKGTGQKCEKPWENLWFCSGEDRNRTTYKFPGKLALRHHARREIRRAPRNRQRARQRTSDGFRIQVTAFGTALFEMKRSRHILPLLYTF